MINNPMTSDFIRDTIAAYPQTLRALFSAVNNYAYDASAPIESTLGEYYKRHASGAFHYGLLITAVRNCIQNNIKDIHDFSGRVLTTAAAEAGLSPRDLDLILNITAEEALRRINGCTSANRTSYSEHGHHGRQYIARNTVERVMREVLPLKP